MLKIAVLLLNFQFSTFDVQIELNAEIAKLSLLILIDLFENEFVNYLQIMQLMCLDQQDPVNDVT